MKAYLVSYDLKQPSNEYGELIEAIKALSGNWCKPLKSVWIVMYEGPCWAVRDQLLKHIGLSDELFVTPLTGDWATYGLNKKVTDWLSNSL